jgi:cell division protein FtsB
VATRPTVAERSGRPDLDDLEDEAGPVRLARLLSVRALVLAAVLLVAFTLLFPSVQAYLGQRAELDTLTQELAAAHEREKELQGELDRWDDPAYVRGQARERLRYAMPGETPFRVIDPEVVEEAPAVTGGSGPDAGAALPLGGVSVPWYSAIWESVEVAGSLEPEGGR